MKTLTIDTDGTTLIYEGKQTTGRPERQKDSTSVIILSNVDVATVTFGTKNSSGTFVSFLNGAVATSSKINHGPGISLWVNVSGITANSVEIGVSN